MAGDIYEQDRFYADLQNDSIVWMYHNPDAVSGDQFVSNKFDIDLLREAIQECPIGPESGFEATPIYDYIAENCRQYLSDVGMIAYESDKEQFESEPIAIGMSHTTIEKLTLMFDARDLIDQFCVEEYGNHADFTDLKKIGIAYTTTEDDKHEIQAYANLIDHCTEICLDGEILATQKSESLKDYVNNQLPYLDFGELVDIPDWVMDEHLGRGLFRKDLQFIQFNAWGVDHETVIEVGKYVFGNNLALNLEARTEDGLEPYSNITVNLPDERKSGPNCAFVDTNNFGMAEEIISEYKLGKPTGHYGYSGYCSYPEYKFDMDEIRKYCINPDDIPTPEPKRKEKEHER